MHTYVQKIISFSMIDKFTTDDKTTLKATEHNVWIFFRTLDYYSTKRLSLGYWHL